MQGKIALEEHFAFSDTLQDSAVFVPPSHWPELKHRITDIHDTRIREMDKAGIEMMLLSLNAPAVQAIVDVKRATDVAHRANDYLAAEIGKNPKRFQGLAALAMQDPDAATREIERCVKQLGFRGALVNGFSQAGDPDTPIYLDDARYNGFWAKVAELDVPFYLHPRNPLPQDARIYAGHPWLMGPTWAFGQETAVHALRLMCSGLFDRHPNLQIVLGHMGEGLPVQHLALRQPQQVAEPAARISGQAPVVRILPGELLHHGVGQLLDAGTALLDAGGRRRPHPVLHRLAVRGNRPSLPVVRRMPHRRIRPPQDRPHEYAAVVQAVIRRADQRSVIRQYHA